MKQRVTVRTVYMVHKINDKAHATQRTPNQTHLILDIDIARKLKRETPRLRKGHVIIGSHHTHFRQGEQFSLHCRARALRAVVLYPYHSSATTVYTGSYCSASAPQYTQPHSPTVVLLYRGYCYSIKTTRVHTTGYSMAAEPQSKRCSELEWGSRLTVDTL